MAVSLVTSCCLFLYLFILYSFSYSIGITSTDNGTPSLSFTKYITVSIDDVNEEPTNIIVSHKMRSFADSLLFTDYNCVQIFKGSVNFA